MTMLPGLLWQLECEFLDRMPRLADAVHGDSWDHWSCCWQVCQRDTVYSVCCVTTSARARGTQWAAPLRTHTH